MSTLELQENYSSDSSNDADYIPDANEVDSEEEYGLVEMTQDEEDLESKLITRSKRKKIEAEIETYNNIKKQKFEEKISKESNSIDEERKNKIDALWAELNKDDNDNDNYSPIPSVPSKAEDISNDNEVLHNDELVENNVTEKQKFPLTKAPISTNMITITKTYKFAGEIITEHKQVPEYSEEAISFLKEQEEDNKDSNEKNEKSNPTLPTLSETPNPPSTTITKSPSSNVQKVKSLPKSNINNNNGKFGRSKVSLEQLSASIKKKPKKLNTLEKSKMDWKKYVEREQLVDELKYHNKNGYIEKQEFLQRTYEKRESELKSLRKDSRNK